MSPFYSRKVFDHFRNPRNARVIENPSGTGRAINEACSDVVEMYVLIEEGTVADVAFKAQGCVACIAGASMTTELAMGQSVESAITIDKHQVSEALDGLPEGKLECSMISPTALKCAIDDAQNGTK